MTIMIAFHGSGAKTFKDFYTLTVLPHWRKAFPNAGELQPLCRTDALVFNAVLLFSEHTQGSDERNCVHRLDPD